eukprot:gene11323-307_t
MAIAHELLILIFIKKTRFRVTDTPEIEDKLGRSRVGSQGLDDFVPLKVLGKGASGKATLVQSKAGGHKVVLKQVNLRSLGPEDRDAALNEVDVLKSLNHPNIIKYYNCFEEHTCIHIVMEWADGGDLDKVVKRSRSLLSEEKILDWFIQIVLALKHMHQRNILHRTPGLCWSRRLSPRIPGPGPMDQELVLTALHLRLCCLRASPDGDDPVPPPELESYSASLDPVEGTSVFVLLQGFAQSVAEVRALQQAGLPLHCVVQAALAPALAVAAKLTPMCCQINCDAKLAEFQEQEDDQDPFARLVP